MAAKKEFTAPAWVFPGARVVVTDVARGNVQATWVSTVEKVGKGWITLSDSVTKIAVDKLESANLASGGYDIRVHRITEEYSEEGQRLLREARINRATGGVTGAFEAWRKNPRDETTRNNLRSSLNRLDNVITED